MTEDQAKNKWCPMGRILYCDEDGSGAGVNDPVDKNYRQNCIGSKCMMWRETVQTVLHSQGGSAKIIGFCGLGGKP